MLVRNIMTLDGLVNGVQGFVHSFKYAESQNKPCAIHVKFEVAHYYRVNKLLKIHERDSVIAMAENLFITL